MPDESTTDATTHGHKIKALDANAIAERYGEQLADDPREQPDASSGWRDEYAHQAVAPFGGAEEVTR